MNTEIRKENVKLKKNIVLIPVSQNSLHRQFLKGNREFDIHLLIFDDSYKKFCNDSEFVTCMHGYKMDMVYKYLINNPKFLNNYEYFFLADDDIRMTTESVNELFRTMRHYNLSIAQPSLTMSYSTYDITMHNPICILRYTDFVEMMIPCFSHEALIKVLPTFKEQVRWRGIEFHWPILINTNHKDMAIIDKIKAIHTRPIQSNSPIYWKMMDDYMKEHNLKMNENVYEIVYRPIDSLIHEGYVVDSSNKVNDTREQINRIISSFFNENHTISSNEITYIGISLFIAAFITEKREYYSAAKWWFDKLINLLSIDTATLTVKQKDLIKNFLSILTEDNIINKYGESLPSLLTYIYNNSNYTKNTHNMTKSNPSIKLMKNMLDIVQKYNTRFILSI